MSKTGKIAAICAAILVIGLVLGGAGYALGGVSGLDKMSEKHSWIGGTPGDRVIFTDQVADFDSVEVTGNADVYLVTEKYFKDQNWLDKKKLLSSTEADSAGNNQVVVIKGEKVPDPQISSENGVLRIFAKEKRTKVSFNFSMSDWTPKILICCPDKEYKSFNVNVDTGDIFLGGVSYKEAVIGTDTGDVATQNVKGESQTIEADTGDVSLSGEFGKTVDIELDTGDVSFQTNAGIDSFGIDAHTDTGDLTIKENGQKTVALDDLSSHFTREGSGTQLIVNTDTGDILLSFGK